jgi:phage shock protein A
VPDATTPTIALTEMLAYVSLGASLLVAGRVVFSTESAVKSLEKTSTEHGNSLNALLASSVDIKTAHAALVERVNSINATMESKASVESVSAVREAIEKAVDNLRREQEVANKSVIQHLERIEAKMEKRS